MILYETGTTDFSKNGLGFLTDVISASVVDSINDEYSLTFSYPINSLMSDEIKEGRIVKCKVADGSNQCFIIKNITKTYKEMSVQCTHLFYLLLDDFADDIYPQNLSPKPFLEWILARLNYQLPFTVTSDISSTATARYVRRNAVDIILGDSDNTMKTLFGMELERNNWNIGLKARLGANNGEKLIYGKNINGINVTIDDTGVYTRIMPMGFDGLILPEKYVDADNILDYPYPRICLYEFSNIKYDPNDPSAYQTLNDAYDALRDATEELYDKGINLPKINIEIDWLELSKTEEYKNYSALERVHLGEKLTSNIFGMDYTTRVIKTTYNPLNDRVEGFEIGTFQPTFTSYTTQLSEKVQEVNPESILAQASQNATNLINSAMGGYVYKTQNELYIMDTNDPATAQNVWRWNINGLGYSSTGINGTYGLAMTMDGAIVADFITAGQIDTSVINGYDSLTTQVYANTNNLDNVNSDLQQYKSQVATQFTQTATDFTYQFNNVNQLINDVSNTTSNNFNEIHKYIRFVNGVIVLGEEGNEMTAELSNNKLSFKQNGTEIAYVSNNKLYITNAEMLNNLVIGNFQFIPRNNGSLSFRKVG